MTPTEKLQSDLAIDDKQNYGFEEIPPELRNSIKGFGAMTNSSKRVVAHIKDGPDLLRKLAIAIKALEFYANPSNKHGQYYDADTDTFDCGMVAQTALKEIGGKDVLGSATK